MLSECQKRGSILRVSITCCNDCFARLQLFLARLRDVLDVYPPPQPTKPAVDLLVKVGEYQSYLAWHNLLPPPGHAGSLDAFEVGTAHAAPAQSVPFNECSKQV